MTRLLIVLAPLALAGCITERAPTLPMALAPAEPVETACLTYGDAPAYGACETARADAVQGDAAQGDAAQAEAVQ